MTSGGTRPKRPAGEGVGGLLSGPGDLINLADPQVIRREMLELQGRLEAGLITEDEYDSAETELLAHLNAITNERSW